MAPAFSMRRQQIERLLHQQLTMLRRQAIDDVHALVQVIHKQYRAFGRCGHSGNRFPRQHIQLPPQLSAAPLRQALATASPESPMTSHHARPATANPPPRMRDPRARQQARRFRLVRRSCRYRRRRTRSASPARRKCCPGPTILSTGGIDSVP